MVAVIKWKEGSPHELPDKVEIPIGIELLMQEKGFRKGKLTHWLESEYKWGIDKLDLSDDMDFAIRQF